MTKDEYIDWAEQLIAAAVEIMTPDQVGQWDGVRAWQESRPTQCVTDGCKCCAANTKWFKFCPDCGRLLEPEPIRDGGNK